MVCKHPGKLETLSYISNSYNELNLEISKKALVYLPYGYDSASDRRYNVLYLMHGGGGSHEEFFGGLDATSVLKPMLDQMIEEEIIEPLIVVTPSFYYEGYPGCIALSSGRPSADRELSSGTDERFAAGR